jgi:hypothetical protein
VDEYGELLLGGCCDNGGEGLAKEKEKMAQGNLEEL